MIQKSYSYMPSIPRPFSSSRRKSTTASNERLGISKSSPKKTPTHLFFLVPGTGPHLEHEKPAGSFLQKHAKLQKHMEKICEEHFSQFGSSVAVIPVPYHHKMHGLDSTDNRMNKITLPTIPWIRQVNHHILGDILYWFSRVNGTKLNEVVIKELNTAYGEFIQKNPDFSGKIGIICHSLGGLICYDILYQQKRFDLLKDANDSSKPDITIDQVNETCPPLHDRIENPKTQTLDFKPSFLFTMGSPVGGSMVFRSLDFTTYTVPCHFHNIFQPYDPFGYRTEPLAQEAYIDEPAVPITALPENQVVHATAISLFDEFSRPLESMSKRFSKPLFVSPTMNLSISGTPRASSFISTARKSMETQFSTLANIVTSPLSHSRQESFSNHISSRLSSSCPDEVGSVDYSINEPSNNREYNGSSHGASIQSNIESSTISNGIQIMRKSISNDPQVESSKRKSLVERFKSKGRSRRNKERKVFASTDTISQRDEISITPSEDSNSSQSNTKSFRDSLRSLKHRLKRKGNIAPRSTASPITSKAKSESKMSKTPSLETEGSDAAPNRRPHTTFHTEGINSTESIHSKRDKQNGHSASHNFKHKDSDLSEFDANAKSILAHIMLPSINRYPSEPVNPEKGYPRAHYEHSSARPKKHGNTDGSGAQKPKQTEKSESDLPQNANNNAVQVRRTKSQNSEKGGPKNAWIRHSLKNFKKSNPQGSVDSNLKLFNEELSKGRVNQAAINNLIHKIEDTISDPLISSNIGIDPTTREALSRLRVISATMGKAPHPSTHRSKTSVPSSPLSDYDDIFSSQLDSAATTDLSTDSTSSLEPQINSPKDATGASEQAMKLEKRRRRSVIEGVNPVIALMHQSLNASNTDSLSEVYTMKDLDAGRKGTNVPTEQNSDNDPTLTPNTADGDTATHDGSHTNLSNYTAKSDEGETSTPVDHSQKDSETSLKSSVRDAEEAVVSQSLYKKGGLAKSFKPQKPKNCTSKMHSRMPSGRVTFEMSANTSISISSHSVNGNDVDDNDDNDDDDLLPPLPYPERMDYIISWEKRHLTSEYWLGLKGHFTYWTNKDIVYHILHHSIIEDDDASTVASGSSHSFE